MKRFIIKAGLVMISFLSIYILALKPETREMLQEALPYFLEMLQEFVKKDVVGIV